MALAAGMLATATPVLAERPVTAGDRFVVYYADREPPAAFARFRWAALDADYHPPLREIAAGGTVLLGYISLGEVERYRSHFAEARDAGLLYGANPNWPDSHYVDFRNPRWRDMVLDRLMPAVLARGFHGVVLDTLDNAEVLEQRDPARFGGMMDAAVQLMRDMRRRFPHAVIMVNRGYHIGERIAESIDILLAECLLGGYDFAAKRYKPVPADDTEWQLRHIEAMRRRNPALRVLTLDYWDPKDAAGIRRIYERSEALGFVPYVATIDLHRILPEPAP